MKYYKNKNTSDVMAFESDGSQDHLIKPGLVKMTAVEVDAHLNPPKTQAELDAQTKQVKQGTLATLTVKTSYGNVFDGNETARNNMLSAIQASAFTGTTTTNWRMADNSIVSVTLDELKEALTLSIQAVGVIVTEAA